jgi:beta-1,4-mannosyl-glycoprotein beta-1,4-N-acetylglucosaminyltransferase
MKIFDCFTFYNEFDLLELRFQELYDVVDHFVISEANTTHSAQPKPFLFLDNLERYKPYLDKVIYVKVEDMPGAVMEHKQNPHTGQLEALPNFWHNERHQRDSLARGLANLTGDDVVVIGDIDEFIRPECIAAIRNDQQHSHWAFRMPMFNYRFNYMWTEPLIYQVQNQALRGTRAAMFNNFTHIREIYGANWANRPNIYDNGVEYCFQHAGWHFSSLGDSKHVANKLKTFAHSELAFQAETIDVDKLIAENKTSINANAKFEAVKLDEYFPKSLLANKEKYQHLIIADAEDTASNKLKNVLL